MTNSDLPTPAKLNRAGRLAFLFKDTVLYGGAAAFAKAFSLITFPLLARHFSVESYGVVDFFLVMTTFLGTFFIFGQDSAVARFLYEYEDDHHRRQMVSQSLVFQLGVVAVFAPLMWWQAEYLASLLIEATDSIALLKLVILQLPFLVLINFSRNILKWTFARRGFLVMSLGVTVVQALFLVIAVMVFDAAVTDILIVCLCSNIVFGCLAVALIRQWLVWPTDMNYLRELIPYAAPYVVVSGLATFMPTLERSMIDRLLDGSYLGFYAVATKVAMLLSLVVQAFQTAWGPFSLSLHKQADAISTYNLVLKAFTWFICVAVLGLTIIAGPTIHVLASERYMAASQVVFPLAMGLALQAIGWITEIGIGISKRTHFSLLGLFAYVVTAYVGILLLTPPLGMLGVGLAAMLGLGVRALVASALAQYVFPMSWDLRSPGIVVGATLLFGLLAVYVAETAGGTASISVLITGLVSIGVIGWYRLFEQAERDAALGLIRRRLQALKGSGASSSGLS